MDLRLFAGMRLALRLRPPVLKFQVGARPLPTVGLFAGVLFFTLLGSARTFTHHEAHIVQSAREMLRSGDWLIPRVGGAAWLEKPPLPQWLMACSGSIFGKLDEFAARLPAALAGLLGVLAVSGTVLRLRGPNAAILTGIFLASSTSIITYARLAESDIFLWAIVVAALAVASRSLVEPAAATKWWASPIAFFVLLGLTQTAKGPFFGAVMVLAPCAVWLMMHRGRGVRWFVSPFGIIVALAIALAWPVAVLMKFPGAWQLWKAHTFGRLDSATAFNPEPFWYYFATLPWQAAPALYLALPALPRSLKTAWNQPHSFDRWLWVWFVSILAILSAASAKHHHYLIYALPPIAIWAAAGAAWHRDRLAALWRFGPWRLGTPMLALAVIGGAAVYCDRQGIVSWREVLAVGGCALGLLVVLSEACRRRNNVLATAALAVLIGGGLFYVNAVWLPRTDIYKPEGELARRIEARTAPGETVYFFGIDPARMLLDMDRPVKTATNAEDLTAVFLNPSKPLLVTALAYEPLLGSLALIREVDRTPHPKWPGRPVSHTVVVRSLR